MRQKPRPRTDTVAQRLKLQHLSVAMAVAQSGSMGKAARQLAVSQPVVSKTIADLEHLLGVRLFDRSPQGVEPTLYCRALLKRSVAIFDDVKTSIEEIRFLVRPVSRRIADRQHRAAARGPRHRRDGAAVAATPAHRVARASGRYRDADQSRPAGATD